METVVAEKKWFQNKSTHNVVNSFVGNYYDAIKIFRKVFLKSHFVLEKVFYHFHPWSTIDKIWFLFNPYFSSSLTELLQQQNRSEISGSMVTRTIWNRTHEGVFGSLNIDDNGDRKIEFSLLDLGRGSSDFKVVKVYHGANNSFQVSFKLYLNWISCSQNF